MKREPPPFRKSAAKGLEARARECTWPSFAPFLSTSARRGCKGQGWRGARVTGRILRLLAGALPQGDGGDGTVGIRDMCVPTHAAYTEKSRVWKEKSITEGKEKEGGGERRWGGKGRTYGCPRPP